MSTRSLLAVPTGDTWRGRYCHSDGYPSHQLVTLLALVARDGLEPVRAVLTEDNTGWSYLDADPNWQPSDEWRQGDERYALVPGYGLAYTDTVVNLPGYSGYQQSHAEDWFDFDAPQDADAQWAYVLGGLDVLVYSNEGRSWTLRGRVAYGDEPDEERLRVIECGENFERCSHMAWRHFPEAAEANVSTCIWVGIEQPGYHDIRELIVNATGERIQLGGSGGIGTAQAPWRFSRTEPLPRSRYWWASSSVGDLRTFRCLKAGYKLDPAYTGVVQTGAGPKLIPGGTVLE
jgi:hypothetical protein